MYAFKGLKTGKVRDSLYFFFACIMMYNIHVFPFSLLLELFSFSCFYFFSCISEHISFFITFSSNKKILKFWFVFVINEQNLMRNSIDNNIDKNLTFFAN